MHVPVSTYRLQLNKEFSFTHVAKIVPYLKQLGISDCYFSPILQAQSGSTHGYNTTDFREISTDLGGREALKQLSDLLKKNQLGLCVDIVPNHMAATSENPYWNDTIKMGKQAPHFYLFDVNWSKSQDQQLFYRRFFDINELVCLRTEDERVFDETHQLILELIEHNIIQGLRLDHIDGLRKPLAYLQRLQTHINKPFYIVAEKILGHDEELPPSWPLAGTTGYDFLNQLNQLFIHSQGLESLNTFYLQTTRSSDSVFTIKQNSLKQAMEQLFAKELNNLVDSLAALIDRPTEEIRQVLLACGSLMGVYRIYGETQPNSQDSRYIKQLFKQIPVNPTSIQLEQFLLNHLPNNLSIKQESKWNKWRSDWEVFTGPVMAKGFEDTTCYNYYALLSVNEVGSATQFFVHGGACELFHHYNHLKQQKHPYAMNATSTHDTKRSEDVRARLNVLSEYASEWNTLLNHWQPLNKDKKINGFPDTVDELLIYQTLLGAWPLHEHEEQDFKERVVSFMTKSMRERKVHSTWVNPNSAYENACFAFIERLLIDSEFLNEFKPFFEKIAFYGMYNSLTQVVLKTTCPGIPDFYQGSEAFRFDLVDPDNRRPINYPHLNALLSEDPLPSLLKNWKNSAIKVNLTRQLLQLRNQLSPLFLEGTYEPLVVHGTQSEHLIAFIRRYRNEWIAVICCRWYSKLLPPHSCWSSDFFSTATIELESNCYSLMDNEHFSTNDNRNLPVHSILKSLPFAILKNC